MKTKKAIVPVKMSGELKGEVARIAAKSDGLSEQDIIRLAIRKGLPLIEKIFIQQKAA